MRYSKSMIEAVKQVGLYEMMDYAIIDGDNKIIGLYKGSNGKETSTDEYERCRKTRKTSWCKETNPY